MVLNLFEKNIAWLIFMLVLCILVNFYVDFALF